ncbi:MAG: endopeptidase La [Oscillospiraceae bacterium]|nr:endopeptidase La [Oscillospiraceae bacterium]
MSENTKTLPAVALPGMTILPGMVVHFDVSRERSMKAIERAMLKEEEVFLVTQKDPDTEEPSGKDLFSIGLVASIRQVIKLPNNILRILVEGKERAELLYLEDEGEFLEAEVRFFDPMEGKPSPLEEEAMLRSLKELIADYCSSNSKLAKAFQSILNDARELSSLIDETANNLPLYYEDKQRLLEAVSLRERFDELEVILANEINIMEIKKDIQTKVKERVDKNQREYLLREQLKYIREELGEDNTFSDAEHYEEELSRLEADDAIKEKIAKEISRFKSVGQNSSESTVIRGYIETLLEMPWNRMSEDNTDIRNAKKILDEDHYGLDKVKERVLEFLAVRTLTKKGDSPIICLVGPPGTGKTSIAQSVARALNKKYVRICLGGVRDEAEIRGHRRTYVGAMPGRIAAGLKSAGVKNPLMLLDEIDKVSSDYKGDTSSALLEVLDSEQNNKFCDHYIELPIDLSEVLFIATANDVQTIPRPLLDRMEIIEVSSYTGNEKLHIAKEHLLPKQITKNGLTREQLAISGKAMERIIRSYTREAGVRNLERRLGAICRKAAREILEDNRRVVRVTENNLEKYLGRERYSFTMANEQDEIGIVRGLAWTSAGGDTLEIEVNVMPGKGEFALTGQLGDVMKESARAGISYIRSIGRSYNIEDTFFKEHDIHIHIPEGAVPKDGPSAGITMATAMLSAIIQRPVRADLAMTGEITLRGRVLPIGGLKEKLLAAKSAGIHTVLVPKKNEEDVEEISQEIKKGLEIVPVETMEEVLGRALV